MGEVIDIFSRRVPTAAAAMILTEQQGKGAVERHIAGETNATNASLWLSVGSLQMTRALYGNDEFGNPPIFYARMIKAALDHTLELLDL
jgi:hypothetical protein